MYVRGEVNTGFWWRNLREKYLEDLGVMGRNNNKMYFREFRWGKDGFDLVPDRDRWLSLMNAVNRLQVLQNMGHFFTIREEVSFSRKNLPHGDSQSVT
jgi:hypothetical protein